MNAAVVLLAGILAAGTGAPPRPHSPIEGPLVSTSFQVVILDGDKPPLGAEVDGNGGMVPIPSDMTQAGWSCIVTQRTYKSHAAIQSLVCRYAHDSALAKFSATAVCNTGDADREEQRIMIGTDARAVGLVLRCVSMPAVGASI